jgi:hypothetical protein
MLDRLARHRAREREREHVREIEIGLLQADHQRVAIRRLDPRDPFEQERVGRAILGVKEASEGVRVIERGELAFAASEHRVVREMDARFHRHPIGPALIRDLRQRRCGIRHQLRRARQVIVGEQRIEDGLDHGARVVIRDFHRVEPGFRRLERDAQDLRWIGGVSLEHE